MVGASLAALAIVMSYGGMVSSVRCTDPSGPACTGLYYNYGVTGLMLLLPVALGLVMVFVGAISVTRSAT